MPRPTSSEHERQRNSVNGCFLDAPEVIAGNQKWPIGPPKEKAPAETGARCRRQSLGMSLDGCESMAEVEPVLPPFGERPNEAVTPVSFVKIVLCV
jgi:hypothetical protein